MAADRLPDTVRPGGRFALWAQRAPQFVALDVDGTLVGASTNVRPQVAAAIGVAQHAGVRVGIVTGRMRHAVTDLISQLELTGPHVFHNGAEVAASDGEVLAARGLDEPALRHLFALANDDPDVVGEFYADDAFYVTAIDQRSEPHWTILNARPEAMLQSVTQVFAKPVRKVTLTACTDAAAQRMAAAVTAYGLTSGVATSPQTPNLTYVNVTSPGADKGFGVRTCAEHLAISVDDVVMIGDESNDLPAFALAGTAVAMGQAEPAVHAAAHLVVPDVHHDGVAHALAFLTADK